MKRTMTWIVVAVVGVLVTISGLSAVFGGSQSTPTKATLAAAQQPAQPNEWVEFEGGVLYLPETIKRYNYVKQSGKELDATGYLVPLVSQEVLTAWLSRLENDGPAAQLSYADCRVLVSFTPSEFKARFGEIATAIDTGQPIDYQEVSRENVAGLAHPVEWLDFEVLPTLLNKWSGLDRQSARVIEFGGKPVQRSEGVTMTLVGLLLVALGVWRLRSGRAVQTPVPVQVPVRAAA